MKRPIENNSAPGDGVYDPFSGSGTTIIAAEQTGRLACALELDPHYVDVAIRRWEKLTGEPAKHAELGRTFHELSHERREAALFDTVVEPPLPPPSSEADTRTEGVTHV